jgi:4-aminobutyrate aminotransferase-like enzyme
VHPTAVRTRLLERLASIVPGGLRKTFLATTGAEAVEAALKTAVLATGKHRFLSFNGAYHGLSLGSLEVGGIPKFIEPFAGLVADVSVRVDYPDAQHVDAAQALRAFSLAADAHDDLAAVIIEPIQGRGGCIIPPDGYLRGVRSYCDRRRMLLIFDEIYTGFGRTGLWFACEHEGVAPDIMCIGKAMGGGFPISAAVASDRVMDAWPPSSGEALHTSTYLGNPMGCAAALAAIDELDRRALPERARELGHVLERRLNGIASAGKAVAVRGRGCMWGLQLADAALADRAVKSALRRGLLLLQAGPRGDVLSITPPLVMSTEQLHRALDILEEIL